MNELRLEARGAPLGLDEAARATAGVPAGAGGSWRARGVSIDSRTLVPGQLFVAIAGPRFDGHDFLAEAAARGAVAAVVHREGPAPAGLPLLRVADTARALAALAAHVRARAELPVVAVTGSVGKTTTKEMTAALLAGLGPVLRTEGNLNNQYGLPLTLLRLEPSHRTAVLELGMSAAGELRALSALARPTVAVITRVAPVHLEFFASVEAIAAAKAEVLEGLEPGGVAVLNRDDERVRRIGEAHHGKVIWFGREGEVSAEGCQGTSRGLRFDLRIAGRVHDVDLPLPGAHYVSDFLAAAAAAHHLGVADEAIVAAAPSLRAAARRGQVVELADGITLVDDAYNSNPVAVEAAVEALELLRPSGGGRRVAFLGDMLELGSTGPELHRRTGRLVGPRVDVLVAVGALAAHLAEGARAKGGPAVHLFAGSEEAAAAAAGLVRPGDAVLVKGSRGVRMERVSEALVSRLGGGRG